VRSFPLSQSVLEVKHFEVPINTDSGVLTVTDVLELVLLLFMLRVVVVALCFKLDLLAVMAFRVVRALEQSTIMLLLLRVKTVLVVVAAVAVGMLALILMALRVALVLLLLDTQFK
jgi:hypothetical protein